ncbi:DUF3362 domain-containing protein [Aeromonas salmonicida]|nr:DUF3362 domain-containing protein [Aeromonas salmonicida]MDF8330187.1 DUF3362 domain-containing protein [Aeromonas salmonicida]
MLLRYHDPAGWPVIREALLAMGKGHLIGNGPDCLVPPEGRGEAKAARSEAGAVNAPATSRNSGKAGNGKPAAKGNGAKRPVR